MFTVTCSVFDYEEYDYRERMVNPKTMSESTDYVIGSVN